MESLDLKIFKEVALSKSISKAAEHMNYGQPNVTAHIKKLEQELNTDLFVRHSHGVTLTKAGEKLFTYASTILQLLKQAEDELKNSAGSPALRIGATQTLAMSRLPFWLSIYQKNFPQTSISVCTNTQTKLADLLTSQAIDCAFIEETYISNYMESVLSFQEPLSIIAPPGQAEAAWLHMPILVNKIETCPYRRKLIEWLSRIKKTEPTIIELDTVESILRSVSLGMGISLLPSSVLPAKENLTAVQVQNIETITLHLVIRCQNYNRNIENLQFIINRYFKQPEQTQL